MGFFDGNVESGFDALFDWDQDGKLDAFERANQFGFMEKSERAGLDSSDLELMDSDERREALEDAGLDPDDYDFFD